VHATQAPTAVPTTNQTAKPSSVPISLVIPSQNRTLLVDGKFTQNSTSGFVYRDNTFRVDVPSTIASRYADGGIEVINNTGTLFVRLGGRDNLAINNISGGWTRNFTLTRPSDIAIVVDFQLQVAKAFARTEVSEVLCSLDGVLLRNGPNEFLAQLSGDENFRWLQQVSNSSSYKFLGFKGVHLSAINITAGNHTLVVGGHLTRKTFNNEVTIIRFLGVQVYTLNSVNTLLIEATNATKNGNLRGT
jgi:hypothetical protein